ncbi:MAG: cupin domain-containing protein [Gemmatimonadaceae bacterium]
MTTQHQVSHAGTSRSLLGFLAAVVLAGCSGPNGSDAPDTAQATVSPSHLAAYATMAEHTWRPLDPNNLAGPWIAALWGDPSKGPYGALLRFPAGFASPMHSHSADERTVTIQGTALHWTETESPGAAERMTPGSYTFIPANVNHVSSCAAGGQECIAFLTQATAFDFKLAPAAKAATSNDSGNEVFND